MLLVGAFRSGQDARYLSERAKPGRIYRARRDRAVLELSADALERGDEILLEPGEELPVDGVVVSGAGFVEESNLFGPSLPSAKKPGDAVFAGAFSSVPDLLLRVEAAGDHSLVALRDRVVRDLGRELSRGGPRVSALAIAMV